MSKPEVPNPERRSDSALLCLGIGVALMVLSWFLGVGGTLATLFAGGPAMAAGGIAGLLLLPLVAISGFVMSVVGAIWLVVRVLIDQREEHHKERYSRDVER